VERKIDANLEQPRKAAPLIPETVLMVKETKQDMKSDS
jgi:hypothetical protein